MPTEQAKLVPYSDDEAAIRVSCSESPVANSPNQASSHTGVVRDPTRADEDRTLHADHLAADTAHPLKTVADQLGIPRTTVRRRHREGRLGELSPRTRQFCQTFPACDFRPGWDLELEKLGNIIDAGMADRNRVEHLMRVYERKRAALLELATRHEK
jgi:hypothetical protein